MPRRYPLLYPELFAGLDDATVSRVLQSIGSRADGSLYPREVVASAVDRATGKADFQSTRERLLRTNGARSRTG